MREIKFRAWNAKTKEMGFVSRIIFPTRYVWLLAYEGEQDQEWLSKFDEVVLMQYTGLKDKNGTEIYEGDIITTDLERPYLIVEYRNGAFMSNCNDGLEDYYDIFFGTSEEPKEVYKYGEVIGNIYENPELMA